MNDYFIIKMFPLISPPELEFLTGGWLPVSQVVGGEAAVCVFTDQTKASAYQSNYQQMAMGQVKSLEVFSVNKDEIRRLKIISDKLTMVAVDPTLDYGQFLTNEIKSLDEFVS